MYTSSKTIYIMNIVSSTKNSAEVQSLQQWAVLFSQRDSDWLFLPWEGPYQCLCHLGRAWMRNTSLQVTLFYLNNQHLGKWRQRKPVSPERQGVVQTLGWAVCPGGFPQRWGSERKAENGRPSGEHPHRKISPQSHQGSRVKIDTQLLRHQWLRKFMH